jgi:hypothetical protein
MVITKKEIDGANSILDGWDFDIRYAPNGELVLHFWDESIFGPEVMPVAALFAVVDVLRGKPAPADGWRSLPELTAEAKEN